MAIWSSNGPPPLRRKASRGSAFMYSSMSISLVDHIVSGLGKLTGTFLEVKLDSNVERLSASCLRSSCWFIIQPKT